MDIGNFDYAKAMAQIACGFNIIVPRLTDDEVDSYTRPKKRVAKKKYHFLSFDISDEDDEQFFEMTCDKDSEQWVSHKRKRRRRILNQTEESTENKVSNVCGASSSNVGNNSILKHTTTKTVKELKPVSSEGDVYKKPLVLKISKSQSSDSIVSQGSVDNRPYVIKSVSTTSNINNTDASHFTKRLKNQEKKVEINKAASTATHVPKTTDLSPKVAESIRNSKIGKIRVKTAAELGSTVIFVDDENIYKYKQVPVTPLLAFKSPGQSVQQNRNNVIVSSGGSMNSVSQVISQQNRNNVAVGHVVSQQSRNSAAIGQVVNRPSRTADQFVNQQNKNNLVANAVVKQQSKSTPNISQNNANLSSLMNSKASANTPLVPKYNVSIQLLATLYTKFFSLKNQTKIENVAEILKNIAENIKSNSERIESINNNSKLTDAQKLYQRSFAYQEFKRRKEADERKLKEKFQLVINVFDNNYFELLFQLFFLGILKILIVSVSNVYKKGTLFKKLVTLLCTSLTNSDYQNERVFKILKSKDFRDDCSSLVEYIEKYSKTELFGMLFLSDSDKDKMKQINGNNSNATGKEPFLTNLVTKNSSNSEGTRQNQFLSADLPNSGNAAVSLMRRTYGPAAKNLPSAPNVTVLSNDLSACSNIENNANTFISGVNNFIFINGEPKRVTSLNNLQNAKNIGETNSYNFSSHSSDSNNGNVAYNMNLDKSFQPATYSGYTHLTPNSNSNAMKINQNDANGSTAFSSRSNSNNENIQPDSFNNMNKVKVGFETTKVRLNKDQNWNGQSNGTSNLRFLLTTNATDGNSTAVNINSNLTTNQHASNFVEHCNKPLNRAYANGMEMSPIKITNCVSLANNNTWNGDAHMIPMT